MPNANGKPTYTEAQMATKLAIQKHGTAIGHLKEGQERIETAVLSIATKLDGYITAQIACSQKHDDANKDRDRMWSFIKGQWAATGLGTLVASIIGVVFGK